MTTEKLIGEIRRKKSFLCIGLDTDPTKIPQHLIDGIAGDDDLVFNFNKAIIDATAHLAVAFKPNIAFYEANGVRGMKSLEKTIAYLNSKYPELFTIADAKRGDIGNTSDRYAKAFFTEMGFDAVTVTPYMGKDSVEPFLQYEKKHTILLALTSNIGAEDFQIQSVGGTPLYKKVLATSRTWKNGQNLMYVVGATQAEKLEEIRRIVPESFLLVPGIGAQGGDLESVCRYGMNRNIGLLVNVSRSILYASEGPDYIEAAVEQAQKLQQQMSRYMN